MICNSIGVAHMEPVASIDGIGKEGKPSQLTSRIKEMRFYWGSDPKDGSPMPVFDTAGRSNGGFETLVSSLKVGGNLSPEGATDAKQLSFWPSAGLAFVPKNRPGLIVQDVRLVVVGQIVEALKSFTGNGGILSDTGTVLSFTELGTGLQIVSNPYDPPDSWEYLSGIMPIPGKGQYRW